nr:zinc finger, CCHC-type [Tanacetum cinerariifolium]
MDVAVMSVMYVLTTLIPEDGENAIVDQIRRRNKWDNDDYVCRGLILKDFKHTLKHLKEELTLVKLGSHLRIEESLGMQDSDKPKGNNVVSPLVVNMVDHNNSFRLNIVNDNIASAFMSTSKPNDSIMCHARLGHVYFKRMQEMSRDGLIPSFDMDTKKAINDEIDSIIGNNTWVLADLPLGCKPLGCKWIFKRKLKVDGTFEKFKAMLVIQGFKQKSGINYLDTYALVARISTMRLLITMASIHNPIIHQIDLKTTFLNGELDEEVYMNKPHGFIMHGNEDKVCKLIKTFYGLKQAHKKWYQKFDEVVLSNGYLLNQAEKCVYSKFDEFGKGFIIFLYVDDMLIFSTDQVQVDLTKEFLSSRLSMKDIGEVDVILGIRIEHESNGIAISQSYYIENVLKKFNYFDCTAVSAHMDTSEKSMPNNGQAVSQLEYSRVIGCLMYAMTCTRPDIAFAVGKLSWYTRNLGTQHWQAIHRVLKYLKKTMDYRLTYTGYPSILEDYTDASWINNIEDNSSTSGWVFLLGG